MKYLVTLVLIAGLQINMPAQKTAFISETKILKAAAGYEKSVKEMDSVKVRLSAEVKENQDQLKTKLNTLLSSYKLNAEMSLEEITSRLNDSDKKKLDLLQEEAQLLDKKIKNLQEDYEALYKVKVGVILERINAAISTYCKTHKIDILYKLESLNSAMGYMNPSLDITDQIAAKLK